MREHEETGTSEASGYEEPNVFRREGEYWSIAYAGDLYRLRDSKGLRYIAHLLKHPGEGIAAVNLVAIAETQPRANLAEVADEPTRRRDSELARVKVTRAIRAAMRRIGACSPPLIAHLNATLKTGSRCSYEPDPRLPVMWQL
jgi:hypothetical protein